MRSKAIRKLNSPDPFPSPIRDYRMSLLTTVYATDEAVSLRAPADFALLCPRDQVLAAGTDGVFDPSDRWTMFSPSVNFSLQGVAPGQVVQLLGPITIFRPPGDVLIVDSVAQGSIVLRRKGQAAGVGQPPSPPSGGIGVEFLIATLGPQIENASYDLNRRFGIDDLIAGRRSSDLYDLREVREAAVLTVLQERYLDLSRDCDATNSPLASKAEAIQHELEALLARAVVHWTSSLDRGGLANTNRFSTRLER